MCISYWQKKLQSNNFGSAPKYDDLNSHMRLIIEP